MGAVRTEHLPCNQMTEIAQQSRRPKVDAVQPVVVPTPWRPDDNRDIRGLWSVWLMHCGFGVDEAANGADAVYKAVASRPELVLMDLWMPVMDGLTATARLKADPRTAAIPVIALSADGDAPVRSRATAAGVDAFLQKPCEFDALMHSIRVALRKRG